MKKPEHVGLDLETINYTCGVDYPVHFTINGTGSDNKKITPMTK